MSISYKSAELFHVFLRNFTDRIKDTRNFPSNLEGLRENNLESLCSFIKKMRAFENSDSKKTIGVFGPPKRGKSTIINVLLGCDLMPTSPIPMSSTVIESTQDDGVAGWEATVVQEDGFQETLHFSQTEIGKVKSIIEQYGSRRGGSAAARMEIKSSFPNSRILANGGILVDTPGAEMAFEESGNQQLGMETKRALEILDETNIIVFCMRADQIGAENERKFYQEQMRRRRTLNVVNFKDCWTDGESLLEHSVRAYGLNYTRTLCISARQASEGGTDRGSEQWRESSVIEFEERIIKEIEAFRPEKGLPVALSELDRICESLLKNEIDTPPSKLLMDNFIKSMTGKNNGGDTDSKIVGSICKKYF
jgi:ribosome biogenesis GTPase A